MAAPRYNNLVSGQNQNLAAAVTSVPNAIVATNAAGYLDPSLMPPGVNEDIVQAYPTESIAQGAPVSLYQGTINSSPATCARNADSATANNAKQIDGYAPTALTASTTQTSSVYRSGPATGLTGLSPGSKYYLGPAGTYVLATASNIASPSSGTTVQYAGVAMSATVLDVQPGPAYAIQ